MTEHTLGKVCRMIAHTFVLLKDQRLQCAHKSVLVSTTCLQSIVTSTTSLLIIAAICTIGVKCDTTIGD